MTQEPDQNQSKLKEQVEMLKAQLKDAKVTQEQLGDKCIKALEAELAVRKENIEHKYEITQLNARLNEIRLAYQGLLGRIETKVHNDE